MFIYIYYWQHTTDVYTMQMHMHFTDNRMVQVTIGAVKHQCCKKKCKNYIVAFSTIQGKMLQTFIYQKYYLQQHKVIILVNLSHVSWQLEVTPHPEFQYGIQLQEHTSTEEKDNQNTSG